MGNEAAEKTEEATTRRRTKERERGNVSKSRDMDSALVMVAGIALLALFIKSMLNTIINADTVEINLILKLIIFLLLLLG